MANILKIKRGTKASLPTLAAGEPGWCTDAEEFYVGNGAANRFIGGPTRVNTIASSATPTPACDTTDLFTVTALAEAAAFGAPTGTPFNGQKLIIRIKDNGTARGLSWNAIYRASTDLALPTTTVISKTMYCGFIYNSADSKWDFVALTQGF